VDASDRSGDRSTGDRGQHLDGRVTGEHADRSASRWRTKVSPDDVASGYHSGAV
jgi:hypothetical protein